MLLTFGLCLPIVKASCLSRVSRFGYVRRECDTGFGCVLLGLGLLSAFGASNLFEAL